jgi:hypothetical protein
MYYCRFQMFGVLEIFERSVCCLYVTVFSPHEPYKRIIISFFYMKLAIQ